MGGAIGEDIELVEGMLIEYYGQPIVPEISKQSESEHSCRFWL